VFAATKTALAEPTALVRRKTALAPSPRHAVSAAQQVACARKASASVPRATASAASPRVEAAVARARVASAHARTVPVKRASASVLRATARVARRLPSRLSLMLWCQMLLILMRRILKEQVYVYASFPSVHDKCLR
jgi:hypothetical protein